MENRRTTSDLSVPIKLRGHTLLCLQGFRGEGYSSEFVSNMAAIHRALNEDPERQIEVIASPDTVCAGCPHRRSTGCTLNGTRSEAEMVEQDHEVMGRLGLAVGNCLRYGDLLERIRKSVRGDDLPSICGNCRWMPFGYCREALDQLRNQGPPSCLSDDDMNGKR